MSRRTRVLALLPALLAACGHDPATPRVVAFLGDSITYGTVRAGPHGTGRDRAGGYPGRLQRLLGPRARVLNRGVEGATAGFWLLDPREGDGGTYWNVLKGLLDTPPTGEPPPGAQSLALAVLGRDRPDVVVILLGVNASRNPASEPSRPGGARRCAGTRHPGGAPRRAPARRAIHGRRVGASPDRRGAPERGGL